MIRIAKLLIVAMPNYTDVFPVTVYSDVWDVNLPAVNGMKMALLLFNTGRYVIWQIRIGNMIYAVLIRANAIGPVVFR